MELDEIAWKNISDDDVFDIKDQIVKASLENKKIHIGCDSQQRCNDKTEFVTVLVILTPGKGGRIFYTKKIVDRIASLRERLLKEVMHSIELAITVSQLISESTEVCVHVDANPNLKFKSSKHIQDLIGYVMGQGFTCITKPDSWAAMNVADRIVKNKHLQ